MAAAVAAVLLVFGRRDEVPPGDRAGSPGAREGARRVVRADAAWGELAGRVVDFDGAPVPDALVVAQDLEGFGGLARTAPDGSYSLALMPCDRVRPPWPDRGWRRGTPPLEEATILVAARAEGFTRSTTWRVAAKRSERTAVRPVVLYRGGRIAGRVLGPDGAEVAARVRVVSVDSRDRFDGMQALPPAFPEGFVESAPGRGFAIGPVGPGEVALFAAAPGLGANQRTVVVTEGQTTTADLVVRIQPSISGRVVDEASRAVAGVRVTCFPEASPDGRPVPKVRVGKPGGEDGPPEAAARGVLATDTGETGEFAFYGVREDRAHTVAVAGAPDSAVRGVAAGRSDLVLAVPRPITLTGVVRDAGTGAPIEGCAVLVLPAAEAGLLSITRPIGLTGVGAGQPKTDAAGAFVIPGLFPGAYRLALTRPGYEVGEVDATIPLGGADPAGVEARLTPAAALSGLVTDGAGRAAAGVDLVLAPPGAPAGPPRVTARAWSGRLAATTDARGAFSFPGLPAGVALTLRARAADGRSARRTLTLAIGENREERVVLEDPAVLEIRVSPATLGCRERHPVRLIGVDDPEIEVLAETDAEGTVRVDRLPPGRYRVLASDPREDPSRPDVAARVVEVDLSPGATAGQGFTIPDVALVRGRVTIGGEAVADGRVGFGPLAGTPDWHRPLLFRVRGGAYEGLVPPGRYHVSVEVPGRRVEIEEVVEVPAAAEFRLDWSLAGD